ncbi:MAG TPA: DEAD/DEAH box helicase [Thermoplasmata archaeon]|nr:DEAD/DEAH box helicase [Thermoplasmata archaeon]
MGEQRTLEEFLAAGEPLAAPIARRRPDRPPALPGVWQVDGEWIVHPLVVPRTIRALPFQLDLARVGLAEDLLVVLPTGMGKTVIAALVVAERIRADTGKVLFLAPTRPLVEQHAESFERWLVDLRTARFAGTVGSPIRQGSWEEAEAVFATPQIIANDVRAGRYALADVGTLIVDEAHRTVGKYAYVGIAERYRAERPVGGRVLALTASPGGEEGRIEGVVAALGVERVEARQRSDEGVREFVQPVTVEHRWVRLSPAARHVQDLVLEALHEEGHKLQKMGYLRTKPLRSLSMKDLLALRGEIFARPGPMVRKFGPLYHQMLMMHLHHALERLETQGVGPFLQYLDRVNAKPKPGKADRALPKIPQLVAARSEAELALGERGEVSHPKLDVLAELVDEEIGRPRDRPPRILVFAQYRDTIQEIQDSLEAKGHRVGRFVGQATRDAGDRGMKQREQSQVLEGFRQARFPVLVASSVAEEGIDVPDVDLVVFFEAIPSEIRAIQRRGRTGRSSVGRVVVLLTEETRDVSYQRAEARREQAMTRVIRRLSRQGRLRKNADPTEVSGTAGSASNP